MKKLIKLFAILLIIFSSVTFSAFNFTDAIEGIGNRLIKIFNSNNNLNNIDKEYSDIFDDLFNNIKDSLENSDINLTQSYIVEDIKYKSSINYVVNNYSKIKDISKIYFEKIDYNIKNIKVNSDDSININVDINVPNITKLLIFNLPSLISKNIFSNFNFSNPSQESVDELITILIDLLDDDNISMESHNFDFKIIKYNNVYKIESINNIIDRIEENISSLLNIFNSK